MNLLKNWLERLAGLCAFLAGVSAAFFADTGAFIAALQQLLADVSAVTMGLVGAYLVARDEIVALVKDFWAKLTGQTMRVGPKGRNRGFIRLPMLAVLIVISLGLSSCALLKPQTIIACIDDVANASKVCLTGTPTDCDAAQKQIKSCLASVGQDALDSLLGRTLAEIDAAESAALAKAQTRNVYSIAVRAQALRQVAKATAASLK